MSRRIVSGLCFYLLLGSLLAHAGQFLDAPQYTVGTDPEAVVVADFNGDGIPDLAVVNSASNTVSILIGNGDGTFKTHVDYTTGTSPFGIAVGNFGNGQQDLAVTNSASNTVSILLGNGDGTFQAKVDYSTGASSAPQGIAVGDVNGDGKLDIAVADSGIGKVGILLGSGTGTFGAATNYTTGNNPTAVVMANFHNAIGTDSILDLAVADKSTGGVISILLNSGTGTFPGQLQVPVAGIPVSLIAADFNGDGYTDLAVANQPISPSLQGTVSVLLSDKVAGGFSAHVDYNIGSSPGVSASPTTVATGVFTTSGHLDLAITAGNDNAVAVLTGNGDGTFKNEVRYGAGATPLSAVVATLIPNGKSDIVVTDFGAASVSVLMGNGDAAGTFQSRIDTDSGPQPNAVVAGDFNGDGNLDLVFADGDCATPCTPNSISLILGNGDGTFQQPNTFTTVTGSETDTDTYALVAADFNGDQKLDIAAINNNTNNMVVLLGNGDGTFQLPLVSYTVGTQPTGIATGDFNGDGVADLVVSNYGSANVSVLFGNGDGTFQAATNYAVGHGPYAVAQANLNADTFPDLVVVNETDRTVSILLGKNNGTFNPQVTYATTLTSPNSVAIGDFNGDGKLDLAVGDAATANVAILLGNGDGTFQAAVKVATGADVFSLVAADFNGDGKTDLAITGQSKTVGTINLVSLLLGNGDGTFQASSAATLFSVGSQAPAQSQSIAFGDFNGDGALDLAVANGLSSDASVLLNSSGVAMALNPSAGNPSYGAPVTFTATVAPSVAGAAALTGTVTFKNGASTIGSPVTVTNGAAAITTATLPVGTDSISAVYSGNYQARTITIPEVVGQAATTTVLSPLTTSGVGQSVTFTATVCPAAGCPATATAPTGTVTFLDGTTTLGTGSVNSSGVATYSTSSLALGTHVITASYAGDANYTASLSPAVNQVVNAPGFGLSASALSPASVTAGASSSSTVTITPSGGLSATSVSLTCAVSPSVSKGPTCSFGTISSGGTATLTVATTAATTAMAVRHTSMFYAMWLVLPGMVFGSVLLPKQKRNKLAMFAAILFISAGCVFQSACGGGGSKTTTNTTPGTPSGNYTVTVSGSATGATTQSASPLTLTVQ